MSKFYRITADTDVTDYVRPSQSLYDEACGTMTLAEAVRQGKEQFIDPAPLTIGLDDKGGVEFPDLLYYEGVPLFSAQFCDCLEKRGAYLPFRKSVTLQDDLLGYVEKYLLIIPPRIGNLGEAGRYKLFSLADSGTIIATEDVKEAAENAHLENVYFDELEEE